MKAVEQSYTSKFTFLKYYEDVHDYPLANGFPLLLCICGAYLLFVLKLGPEFMKNRKPYKLKTALLLYNGLQIILSAIFVYLAVEVLSMTGIFPKQCYDPDPVIRKKMYRGFQIYLCGKITELLDTIFFVLRKKYNQVSFLHVYHHTTVIIGTWLMFRYAISLTNAWIAFINSLVHVVMYFYYFMAALGPRYQKYLTWKKHITSFQLFQFVTVIIHQIVSVFYTKCQHSILGIVHIILNAGIFYYLFSSFYNERYVKPTKSAAGNGAKARNK